MARPIKRKVEVIDWVQYFECSKCWKMKDYTQFYKWRNEFWYRPSCIDCCKQWRKDNLDYRRERDKKYYREHCEQKKEYNKMYREKNKDKLKEYDKQKRDKWWYVSIHNKTIWYVRRNKIKHDTCCICWSHIKIELHHPDYNKRNEVCIVCNSCHKEIHSWCIECPKPINLLDFKLN